MKIVYNSIIPFKGFSAINILGILFARRDAEITERLVRHEQIHSMQQRELLWLFFYVWYLLEWIVRVLFTKDRFSKRAYFNISFEREAYENQHNVSYIKERKHYCWMKYITNKK